MWISNQYQTPHITDSHILRSSLLEKLASSKQKVIFLQAPAGYGKSSLIAQWLNDKNYIGWLSLDQLDNDPTRFTLHLSNAINQALKDESISATSSDLASPIRYMSTLIEQLDEKISSHNLNAYLVIDNYQHIDHPEINNALKFLLNNQPKAFTIVVLSRTIPNVGIANLRARQNLLELTREHLCFSKQEVQAFVQYHFDAELTQEQLTALEHYSAGWPCALQLLAMQSQYQLESFLRFFIPHSPFPFTYIWDYFTEEVYEPLRTDIKQFLLKTSIVDVFNQELAQAIVPDLNSTEIMAYIARNELFITSLDHGWYRYHPLFFKYLCHHRQISYGTEENQSYLTVSFAWELQENPTRALDFAVLADNSERVSNLIQRFGWTLFHHGELEVLEKSLDILNRAGLNNDPNTALLNAWILQTQFRFNDVEIEITRFFAYLSDNNISLTSNIQGEFNALLAQTAIKKNQPLQAKERAEFALLNLDHASYQARLVATSVLGEVYYAEGHLSQALSLMQQTEKYARQHQLNPHVLWALIQQIEIHSAMSHNQTAFELQSTALDYAKLHSLEHIPLFNIIIRLRAKLLCDWNRVDEAEQLINEKITMESQLSEYSHLPAILARIALRKGNSKKANDIITQYSMDLYAPDANIEWQAELSLSLILLWLNDRNVSALEQWLSHFQLPNKFCNGFTQQQGRNQVLALVGLEDYAQAKTQIEKLQTEASEYSLTYDQFKNQVLHCVVALKQHRKEEAIEHLITALEWSLETNNIGEFSLYSDSLFPVLKELKPFQSDKILLKHRIDLLIDQLAPHTKHKYALNQDVIERLQLKNATLPDILKTSPLTTREWQVLTLIYSGLSNEKIAYQFDIAPTTLKTHIRNLYQKLNIPNRKAAKAFAEQLISLLEKS
ncbi:HTH-type transcriptional regulator MalT [Vibrio sp. RC27]